jgi:hypothetical protein
LEDSATAMVLGGGGGGGDVCGVNAGHEWDDA